METATWNQNLTGDSLRSTNSGPKEVILALVMCLPEITPAAPAQKKSKPITRRETKVASMRMRLTRN